MMEVEVDMDQTHYETLGVSESATTEEIKASYRILIRRNHPDLTGSEGVEKTARINAAYTVVGDPDARVLYDADLRLQRQRDETPHVQEEYVERSEATEAHSPEEPGEERPQSIPEEDPLRFIDFWDHPVTRRKIIVGGVGVALALSAAVTAMLLPVPSHALLSLATVPFVVFMWRPHPALWAASLGSAGLPILMSRDDLTSKIVFASLVVLAIFALRLGMLAMRSVTIQLQEDRRMRAQIRREAAAREKARVAQERKAEREAENQRLAAERRAARQAKKNRRE